MITQPFIPAAELKQTYGVFGHFYSVELASKEVVECPYGQKTQPNLDSPSRERLQPHTFFPLENQSMAS